MARAVEDRKPDLAQLQSAAKKLKALNTRIDELVPGDMSYEKKLDTLIQKLDDKVGVSQRALQTTDKLELLGDSRANIAPEVKAVSKKRKTKGK